jgi:hypothetical protein
VIAIAARVVRLHLSSRRIPAAVATLAGCAVVLRIALYRQWDAYGALQLPLMVEAAGAAIIAVATAGPFGEAERVCGRRLPLLRLGTALLLTAAAIGATAVAAIGMDLAGGVTAMARNTAGLVGIGLLCATAAGGRLGWTGPAVYLMVAVYALYTQWHGPALTTPWIWPARPSHDLGAALCAGFILLAGLVSITIRGPRDPAGEL